MSRPFRIEYPGAWYYVMNRGRRADDIFAGKKDYQGFVDLLQETSEGQKMAVIFRVCRFCGVDQVAVLSMKTDYEVPQAKDRVPDLVIPRCTRFQIRSGMTGSRSFRGNNRKGGQNDKKNDTMGGRTEICFSINMLYNIYCIGG
ncbi:MAG: hypothetical protein SWH68_00350 [Thermodesulfobacteriota bacterium]|nr:hypothetical protein [Thermodesulfobacteriota bacterium]